jgi:uncharacterized protein YcnI
VAVGALAAGLVVSGASAAFAHVTVNPSEAPQGGFAKLDFRVPNEKADASTNKVEIVFPEDAVIPFVSVQPVPGWTYTVVNRDLDEPVEAEGGEITSVVSQVTWTGGEIKPGEFQEFPVSLGPLPDDADQLEFKALQTYTDGETVRWIDATEEGAPEPEHPAPVLTLTASTGDEHGGGSDEAAAPTDDGDDGDDSDDSSNTLAIVALVVGGVGVILGGVALARPRKAA